MSEATGRTRAEVFTDWLREQVDHASDVKEADARRASSTWMHSRARHEAFVEAWNEWVRLGGLREASPATNETLYRIEETSVAQLIAEEEAANLPDAGKPANSGKRRCPMCDSPSPQLHPAMQHEGEVQPCPDPWHDSAQHPSYYRPASARLTPQDQCDRAVAVPREKGSVVALETRTPETPSSAEADVEALGRVARHTDLPSEPSARLPGEPPRLTDEAVRDLWRERMYPHHTKETFDRFFSDTSAEGWNEVRREVAAAIDIARLADRAGETGR